MAVGVVSYMILCWGGSILCGVFKCQTWVEKYTSAELC